MTLTSQPFAGPFDNSATITVARARQHWARRLLASPTASICLVFLTAVILVGLIGPWLAPHSPSDAQLQAINETPFHRAYLLGADGSGRDILSRLLWGTQRTLLACVILLATAVTLGVPAGLVAGYRRGWFDAVAMWASDILLTLPGIVLLIALYASTGPNLTAAMIVFGVLIAPSYFRIVRGVVLGVRGELYVDAARVVGLSDLRIIGRHILWAVRAPIIIHSSFVLGAGIAVEAAVDYLGLGDPSKPSWGIMLQEAFSNVYANRWSVLWPSLLISLTILALVLLGNSVRDVLQPGTGAKTMTRRDVERLRSANRAVSTQSADHQPLVPEALLDVRGLVVAYPTPDGHISEVVHGIDLAVPEGKVHGLVGESGSGKTQTAFAILGILASEALIAGGAVYFDGVDLVANPRTCDQVRGRRIAYVPQEPMSNLDPCFTVGAQLVYGLRAVKDITRREAKQHILDLLARVGIRDPSRVFKLYPHEISGGMAQRVLICGAVAGDPDLIIADEPTTALDVTVQAEVLDLLRELRDERGLAMLLVTHNFGVVADLCDTVSVMKDGRIVECGDVMSIFKEPRHTYTKQLLASTRAVDLEGPTP